MSDIVTVFDTTDGREYTKPMTLPLLRATGVRYVGTGWSTSNEQDISTGTMFTSISSALSSSGTVFVHGGIYYESFSIPAGSTVVALGRVTVRPPSGFTGWAIDLASDGTSLVGDWFIDLTDATGAAGALRVTGSGTARVECEASTSSVALIQVGGSATTRLDITYCDRLDITSTGRTYANVSRLVGLFISGGTNHVHVGVMRGQLSVTGGDSVLRLGRHTGENSLVGGSTNISDCKVEIHGLVYDRTEDARPLRIGNSCTVGLHNLRMTNGDGGTSAMCIDITGNSSTRVHVTDSVFRSASQRVIRVGECGALLFTGCTIINTAATATPTYGVELTTESVTNTVMIRASHIVMKSSGATKNGVFAAAARNVTNGAATVLSHAANGNVTWNVGAPATNATGMVEV